MRDHTPELEAAFFEIFADYLDLEKNTSRKYSGGEYNLSRMRELSALSDHPEERFHNRLIHVAGTKGKGATCLFLSSLLRSAGIRVGTFMSPHLATVRERFRIDTKLIDYETLLSTARRLEGKVRQSDMNPTFFELMTILSLQLFSEAACEWAVLETGIGGLLDSTNFIENPACAVITAVSYDHTQLLGNSIEEIATQKAGIIKPGIPVVCGRQPYTAAAEIIRRTADAKGAPFFPVEPAAHDLHSWCIDRLPPFLMEDFSIALTVCQALHIKPDPGAYVRPELRSRCECIQQDPLVVLDAAHNADSARRLAEAIQILYGDARFVIILGVAEGKDAAGIFRELSAISDDFILTNPRTQKGSALNRLIELADEFGVQYTLRPVIQTLADLPAGRNLLFTGSFFTALIGEDLFST